MEQVANQAYSSIKQLADILIKQLPINRYCKYYILIGLDIAL
jgi:hypothetical protein